MTKGFLQKARQEERGTFIVLMALSLLGIFGMAALSIDIGHVFQQKRDMQSATDAAALAGTAILTNAWYANLKADAIQAALTIAESNGVTAAEIAAAVSNDGTIEVGTWNTNNTPPFTANTASGTWNAVRVPAQRSVGLFFGKMTVGPGNGMSAMSPSVHTVAALSSPTEAYNLAPFMLRESYVTANKVGVPFAISHNTYKSTGDFGPLDLPGSTGSLDAQMTSGCGCTVTVGEDVPEHTGNNVDYNMMQAANNTTVIMPIITSDGNHTGEVLGFAVVLITNAGGNHGNWTADFTIENFLVGAGTGGAAGFPFAQDRTLVQ